SAMISTKKNTISFITRHLQAKEWRQKKAFHEQRIGELVDDYLDHRSHHQKDPVMDFLFEYYAFRPAHLRRWTPGFGILLEDGGDYNWRFDEMNFDNKDAFLDIQNF